MDVTIVVQARMGSSRLPGKVLRPLAGRPMLELMLQRLARVHAGPTVLATSDLARDDAIAELAEHLGTPCVRGSEHDVLDRFADAAEAHPADHYVRLTADCPLIDAAIVDDVVRTHVASGAAYTSNTLLRTYPDGLDVEVLTAAVLEDARRAAVADDEREHVTPFVVRRPERHRLAAHLGPLDLEDERWTVDTADDFAFVESILAASGDPVGASWVDLLDRIGVHRAAAPDAVVLRVDRSVPPDPGHRRWSIRRGADTLGALQVDVVDGTGTLRLVAGSPALLHDAAVRAALDVRLRADLQVRTLHSPEQPKDGHDARDLVHPR